MEQTRQTMHINTSDKPRVGCRIGWRSRHWTRRRTRGTDKTGTTTKTTTDTRGRQYGKYRRVQRRREHNRRFKWEWHEEQARYGQERHNKETGVKQNKKVDTHKEETRQIRPRGDTSDQTKSKEEAKHEKQGSQGKQEVGIRMANMGERERLDQSRHGNETSEDRPRRGVMWHMNYNYIV